MAGRSRSRSPTHARPYYEDSRGRERGARWNSREQMPRHADHEDRRMRDERRNDEDRPPRRSRYSEGQGREGDYRNGRDERREDRDGRQATRYEGRGGKDGDRDNRQRPSRRSPSPAPPGPSRARSPSGPRSRPLSPPPSRSKSPSQDKSKPNFNPSGLLAAATNTVKHADGTSTILKYNEPPEARKPVVGWRLYVFKGSDQVDMLHIHRQSAYLIGRDKAIADIPIDHPSCSKQHAVIQFRHVQEKDEFGSSKAVVKPFIIDLESTNGTHVNGDTIPESRYFELKAGDVIKFGQSTREYVLLNDDA